MCLPCLCVDEMLFFLFFQAGLTGSILCRASVLFLRLTCSSAVWLDTNYSSSLPSCFLSLSGSPSASLCIATNSSAILHSIICASSLSSVHMVSCHPLFTNLLTLPWTSPFSLSSPISTQQRANRDSPIRCFPLGFSLFASGDACLAGPMLVLHYWSQRRKEKTEDKQ